MTDSELKILIDACYTIEEENAERHERQDASKRARLIKLRMFRYFLRMYNRLDTYTLLQFARRPTDKTNQGLFPESESLSGRPEYPYLMDVLNRLELSFRKRLSRSGVYTPD